MLPVALTDRQRLRSIAESDAPELYALVRANRAHLARWLPWAPTQTLDDTREFIRSAREREAAEDGFEAAILEEGAIIGMAGFHGVSWTHRSTELGYWLAESAQGRGTMTRAVSALVDHAFSTWRLNRVAIRAAVENRPSRAIAERLGFRREGVLRQVERVGDRFVDHVVYAMLADEWTREPPETSRGRAVRDR